MEAAPITRLLLQMIDGTIDQNDFLLLQKELRNNPNARREYGELLALEHLLAEKYSLPQRIAPYTAPTEDVVPHRHLHSIASKKILVTLAAAAIIVLALAIGFKAESFPATLRGAADSRFQIDGKTNASTLAAGKTLKVERGVVAVELNRYTKSIVEGPAQVRLMDRKGNVELKSGKAFFDVAPGGSGFQVKFPGGVINDIGTKFGVDVQANGSVAMRVLEGQIQVTDTGGSVKIINAGEALEWSTKGEKNVTPAATQFLQALPQEEVIFFDDFSEPEGTFLEGKTADVGGAWDDLLVDLTLPPKEDSMLVSNGMIDSSFGQRYFTNTFRSTGEGNTKANYLIHLTTGIPQHLSDKNTRLNGRETISFSDAKGELKFSLTALATSGHRWIIRDEIKGTESAVSNASVFKKQQLTLLYNGTTGALSLYPGNSIRAAKNELATLTTAPRISINAVTISNADGGDVALDELSVLLIDSPN